MILLSNVFANDLKNLKLHNYGGRFYRLDRQLDALLHHFFVGLANQCCGC